MDTAQQMLSKQKRELKSQLDEYVSQNSLSWQAVKIVIAILESGLSSTGLDQGEIASISKRIAEIGSLTIYKKSLEQEKETLEAKVGELGQQEKFLTGTVNQGKAIYQQLASQLLEKTNYRGELDAQIEAKEARLAQLEEMVSGYGRDLYAAWLVLGFLASRDLISDYDFDQFVKLLLGVRQSRLGIGPKKVTDAKGNVVCQCEVPAFQIPDSKYAASLEEAEQKLALCLVPLVKDKFVSKLEYDAEEFRKAMSEIRKKLLDLELKNTGTLTSTSESN